MASGDSIIGICNLGLVNGLGQDPISALSDNRKAAIHLNLCYDQVRRAVLRAHTWGFATKRAQLSVAATAPAFGFGNAFTLPSDFLRLVPAPGEDSNQEKWKIEGRALLSDDGAPLNIVYIFDCQDPTLFDPLFVEALAYALAAEVAIPITQDKQLRAQMESASEARIAAAKTVSSQDSGAAEWDNDVLLRSRL